MNHKAVCRTAPATPGLLNICSYLNLCCLFSHLFGCLYGCLCCCIFGCLSGCLCGCLVVILNAIVIVAVVVIIIFIIFIIRHEVSTLYCSETRGLHKIILIVLLFREYKVGPEVPIPKCLKGSSIEKTYCVSSRKAQHFIIRTT